MPREGKWGQFYLILPPKIWVRVGILTNSSIWVTHINIICFIVLCQFWKFSTNNFVVFLGYSVDDHFFCHKIQRNSVSYKILQDSFYECTFFEYKFFHVLLATRHISASSIKSLIKYYEYTLYYPFSFLLFLFLGFVATLFFFCGIAYCEFIWDFGFSVCRLNRNPLLYEESSIKLCTILALFAICDRRHRTWSFSSHLVRNYYSMKREEVICVNFRKYLMAIASPMATSSSVLCSSVWRVRRWKSLENFVPSPRKLSKIDQRSRWKWDVDKSTQKGLSERQSLKGEPYHDFDKFEFVQWNFNVEPLLRRTLNVLLITVICWIAEISMISHDNELTVNK